MKYLAKRVSFLASIILVFSACGGSTTKEDVQIDLNENKELISKFSKSIDQTIQTKKAYYQDLRNGTLDSLNNRSRGIAEQIKDLQKTNNDSQNVEASDNIQSAIAALKEEKKGIDEAVEKVKNREKDWSNSYKGINEAIQEIERELTVLDKSLENN